VVGEDNKRTKVKRHDWSEIVNLPKDYQRLAKVVEALSQVRAPALSSYELAKLLFLNGSFTMSKNVKRDFASILETILGLHLLTPLGIANAYAIFGKASTTPADIVCTIDPFSYVSHLSAMEHHGLTDRFSKILYMTRPSAPVWKAQADERMSKDLDGQLSEYLAFGLPKLVRHKFTNVERTPVHFQERSHLGAFRLVAETPLRVATIGRVFLDMLREPKLCGGMQHVLDVYKNEARRYLKFIIDEIERHGQPIDKVRAGFVLSEVCKLDNPIFSKWETFAQRGGSRKLDAEEEFVPQYSERWMLSMNAPSLSSLDQDPEDV
jgi:predicted transcriptional regulator of viral defense system